MKQQFWNEQVYHKFTKRLPCILCEYIFPIEALVGVITYRTICQWKEQHDVNMNDTHTSKQYNPHDIVKLCIFCNQFFDNEYSENVIDTINDYQYKEYEYYQNSIIQPDLKKKTYMNRPEESIEEDVIDKMEYAMNLYKT